MWCPTCEEEKTDHPTVCTTCGESLQEHPRNSTNDSNLSTSTPIQQIIALQSILNNAQAQAQTLQPGLEEEWEQAPPEAMNPNAASSKDLPTSKDYLDRIPRVIMEDASSMLHEATVHCVPPPTEGENPLQRGPAHTFYATTAEFGTSPPYTLTGRLVLVQPPTGAGGQLNATTLTALSKNKSNTQSKSQSNTVAYMERGGNVTFARKALLAQAAGASAVIVGNNNAEVWPYVMKDSQKEAFQRLHIPVVMVKRDDGRTLRDLLQNSNQNNKNSNAGVVQCRIQAQPTQQECVVCRDHFQKGDTVMRLPLCGHVFHQACALAWLTKHHTCPYCRRELPTDDEEYERERRRVRRTHASGGGAEEDNGGENRDWETLFG